MKLNEDIIRKGNTIIKIKTLEINKVMHVNSNYDFICKLDLGQTLTNKTSGLLPSMYMTR